MALLLPSTLLLIIQTLYVSSNDLTSEYPLQTQFQSKFCIKGTASSGDSGVLWLFICSSSFQVEKLVLIAASVYAEGTGNLATLPKVAAYAGVSILCLRFILPPAIYHCLKIHSYQSLSEQMFFLFLDTD